MKPLVLVLTFALSCIPVLKETSAAPKSRIGLTGGVAPKAQLQLTTTIVRERSCFPGHLSLELRFRFRNVGDEPVILDKLSFVDRTLVSMSLKAAASKKYQQKIRAHLYADTFPVNPTDLSDFAIIGPGEVFDLESGQTRVSLFVSEGKHQSKDHLPPGNYFLQVDVATWTYFGDAKQLRVKWRDKGRLWSEGVTSQPMPFAVKQNRPIVKCS